MTRQTGRTLRVIDLGQMSYRDAYSRQVREHEAVLEAREAGTPHVGVLLLVEHVPPVITVSRRAGAADHLLASSEVLEAAGLQVEETDRGGDITYHGPGQLVVYPVVDLNELGLNLHAYIRTLEQAVIDAAGIWGVEGRRESGATGVWTPDERVVGGAAKLCAIGVRVRRWATLHGLALNVSTNLDHFQYIVPCGLQGRAVTSLQAILGQDRAPTMDDAKSVLVGTLRSRLLSGVVGGWSSA